MLKVKREAYSCSSTHLTATECHLPYGITQYYLPPNTSDWSEHTPPNRSQTGRYSIDVPRKCELAYTISYYSAAMIQDWSTLTVKEVFTEQLSSLVTSSAGEVTWLVVVVMGSLVMLQCWKLVLPPLMWKCVERLAEFTDRSLPSASRQHQCQIFTINKGLKVRTFIYHRLQGNQNNSEAAYWPSLTSISSRQRDTISGRPLPKRTDFGPAVCSYNRPTYVPASRTMAAGFTPQSGNDSVFLVVNTATY